MDETASVEVDGVTVESNSASEDELREAFSPDEKPDLKKAASDLGKKGGKASAKKRAEIKPIPPQKAEEADSEPVQESDESTERGQAPESDEDAPSEAPDEPKKAAKGKDEGEGPEEAEEGEDEPQKASEEDQEEAEGEEKPKKRGNPRHDPIARMKEATRQAAEVKRQLRQAQQERDELLQMLRSQPKPGQEEEKKGPGPDLARFVDPNDPEPDEGNYDDFKTYMRDLIRWENRLEGRRRAQESEAERAQRQEWETRQKFVDGMREIRSEISDTIGLITPTSELSDPRAATGENWIGEWLLYNPEPAPAVALYLSGHEDEFQRIASLPDPNEIARALVRLEGKVEALNSLNGNGRQEQRERKVSKAKPPVKPVTGAPYIAEDKNEQPKPGEDFDDWLRRARGGKTR